MTTLINIMESIGTPVVVGLLLAYFQHLNNKRYEKMDKRADLRKKEGQVSADMIEAAMKLSYACAIALQRGKTNGEVDDGVRSFKKAKKAREQFLRETSREYLAK